MAWIKNFFKFWKFLVSYLKETWKVWEPIILVKYKIKQIEHIEVII